MIVNLTLLHWTPAQPFQNDQVLVSIQGHACSFLCAITFIKSRRETTDWEDKWQASCLRKPIRC